MPSILWRKANLNTTHLWSSPLSATTTNPTSNSCHCAPYFFELVAREEIIIEIIPLVVVQVQCGQEFAVFRTDHIGPRVKILALAGSVLVGREPILLVEDLEHLLADGIACHRQGRLAAVVGVVLPEVMADGFKRFEPDTDLVIRSVR